MNNIKKLDKLAPCWNFYQKIRSQFSRVLTFGVIIASGLTISEARAAIRGNYDFPGSAGPVLLGQPWLINTENSSNSGGVFLCQDPAAPEPNPPWINSSGHDLVLDLESLPQGTYRLSAITVLPPDGVSPEWLAGPLPDDCTVVPGYWTTPGLGLLLANTETQQTVLSSCSPGQPVPAGFVTAIEFGVGTDPEMSVVVEGLGSPSSNGWSLCWLEYIDNETPTPTLTPTSPPWGTNTPGPVTNTPLPTFTPSGGVTPTPTNTPTVGPGTPTNTPIPTDTPQTPDPTYTPQPTYTPAPTDTPYPTSTPYPTNTPEVPTNTPEAPTNTPEAPTNTPEAPTNTPGAPTNTPEVPTNTPEVPTNTPEVPTNTPEVPTNTPEVPTNTPEAPTNTPEVPTNTPEVPTNTPEVPTNTPEAPTNTPEVPTNTPEAPTNTPEVPTSTPGAPTNTPEAPTNTPGGPTNTPTPVPPTATPTGPTATPTSGVPTSTPTYGPPTATPGVPTSTPTFGPPTATPTTLPPSPTPTVEPTGTPDYPEDVPYLKSFTNRCCGEGSTWGPDDQFTWYYQTVNWTGEVWNQPTLGWILLGAPWGNFYFWNPYTGEFGDSVTELWEINPILTGEGEIGVVLDFQMPDDLPNYNEIYFIGALTDNPATHILGNFTFIERGAVTSE